MQYLKQDDFPFDPSLESDSVPAEITSPAEYRDVPDEVSLPAPEDSVAPEFGAGVPGTEEKSEKLSPMLLQKLAFFFFAAAIATISVLFAAAGVDPLGNDFLNSGSAVISPLPPSSPSSPSSSPAVKKTPVALPSVSGKVTYNYYVTYAPTNDKFSGTASDEKTMESNVKTWVSSKGGDPDTVVLYDYTLTSTGYETSDDFFMVGDIDDLANAYIISGTLTDTYIMDVYYEGYAKEASAPPVVEYDDAFPVLPNLDPDFAGNYAWSLLSPSPGFKGGTEEYLIVDSVFLVAGTVYTDAGTTVGEVSGASYDKAANTLTLTNFHGSRIEGNLMGNGFKIKLVGDSSIDELMMWGAMYGCSVTFTGSGSIKINENNKASAGSGIYFECEDSMSCLMIDREATVEVFGDYAIVIHRTLMDKAIYTLKPIKTTGGEYSTGEFVEYTVTETLPDGTTRETVRTVSDISKDVGLDLYDYSIIGPDGKPSKHVLFAPGK